VTKRKRKGASYRTKALLWLVLLFAVLSLGWWLQALWQAALASKGCSAPTPLYTIDRFQEKTKLKFVVIGDAGTGESLQKQVAHAVSTVCAQKGCDFVLYLGDNFYPNGVESLDDPLFETAFDQVYREVKLPFFVVLGNHDVRGDVEPQRLYSLVNKKWHLPAYNYSFQAGPVNFFGVNSNCIPFSWFWLKDELNNAPAAPWNMVFTHHNLYGSGHHKDAPFLQKLWWEWGLADQVDFFFSGHEHLLEHLTPQGVPGEYWISGAGGYPINRGDIDQAREDSRFMSTSQGLLWVSVEEAEVGLEFFDLYGAPLYQYQKKRTK